MVFSFDFLTRPGWKRFLVFFVPLVIFNALTDDKMAIFAMCVFISFAIAIFAIIDQKQGKPARRAKK